MRNDVPRLLALGLPLSLLAAVIAGRLIGPAFYDRFIASEQGLVENLTVVFLLVAVAVGVLVLRRRGSLPRYVSLWTLAMIAGCIVFAGEEASWGQHLFGWETPESWRPGWGQQETNLRDIAVLEPLLDNVARNLLGLVALVGGVIVPLWRRHTGRDLAPTGGPGDWLWPTRRLVLTAALAVFITFIWKPFHLTGVTPPAFLDIRKPGEIKECYLGLLLMLYMILLLLRARDAVSRTAPSAAEARSGSAQNSVQE